MHNIKLLHYTSFVLTLGFIWKMKPIVDLVATFKTCDALQVTFMLQAFHFLTLRTKHQLPDTKSASFFHNQDFVTAGN